MPTDFNTDGADADLGSDAPSRKNSDVHADLEDAKRRLAGLSRTVDRLTKDNLSLKEQVDNRSASEESEASKLRVQFTDLQKAFKDKEREAQLAIESVSTKEGLIAKFTAEKAAAKLIADKHPALLEDFLLGDLKLRTDFSDDAEYDSYLERQAKKVTPALGAAQPANGATTPTLARQLLGATPSTVTRVVDQGAGQPRDRIEIAEEMMTLDPKLPAHQTRYVELENEMREATN